jgi:tetratricopeptide (TPR) repeat protein
MLLPLGLAYAVASRLKMPSRIMLGYAALVMVAGIVVTLSRGGWLASAGSMLLFGALLFFRRNLRWPVLLALVLLVATALIFVARSPAVRFRIEKSFTQTQEVKSVENIRFELWSPAARMWLDNFWFGVGPAHFDARFQAYRPQSIQVRPERVHNDYLNTLADWGAVGAAIVLSAWVMLGFGVFKSWKFVRGNARDLGSNQSDKFAFVLGASVGLVAILLHSVVDFNMSIPANAILAVTLMALLTSHLRFATEGYWFTARVALKILVTLALLASIAWLGAQGVRRAREYFWLQLAQSVPVYSLAQIEALQRALAVEPKNFETAYELGEAFRIRCLDGNPNYAGLGQSALEWYARGAALQPFTSDFPLGRGITLDFLDRHDEAATAFALADRLDPNGAFTAAYVGWHHVQTGNYAAARPWLMRALMLDQPNTPMAARYLNIVDRRMREAAAQH